jgi:alanyl-tRNA synthetase
MTSAEIRSKYLEFFKARGHVVIPSASLVPENDPTTLFTGSGMQSLIPYLLGAKHPAGTRLVDSQKSFRAEDIEEVGDNRHTTFFEMLGNWSLGDYFKKEQLPWLFEFLTKETGIPKERLWVTCFEGDKKLSLPRDTESADIWKSLGIPEERIRFYGSKKNWWSRSGPPENMPVGEPGGPDSEVFFEFISVEHDLKFGAECHPNCDCGRFMEIGNSVFMEYQKQADGLFVKLAQRNVDFGGGLERITAAANGDSDMFNIDVFAKAIDKLNELNSERKYKSAHASDKKAFRIIADHIRASVFLIGDGVLPGNKGRNYMVRRLIRSSVLQCGTAEMGENSLVEVAGTIVESYKNIYQNLFEKKDEIINAIKDEEKKFLLTAERGQKQLVKLLISVINGEKKITGDDLADLFTTHGCPLEVGIGWIETSLDGVIPDEFNEEEKQKAKENFRKFFDKEKITIEFNKKIQEHKELSRTASAGTFKGGLADTSAETTRLHTAHHLLLKALQIVLGLQVKQRGSNITSERLRMDFSHDAKMTEEQKKEVERIVNEKIAEDLPVVWSELPREEAEKLGAEHEFGQKYPDRVSVYSIGPKSATVENPQFEKAYSLEFCGGPHVTHTGEIGHFKIVKEEAVAAGIRRIKATIS